MEQLPTTPTVFDQMQDLILINIVRHLPKNECTLLFQVNQILARKANTKDYTNFFFPPTKAKQIKPVYQMTLEQLQQLRLEDDRKILNGEEALCSPYNPGRFFSHSNLDWLNNQPSQYPHGAHPGGYSFIPKKNTRTDS